MKALTIQQPYAGLAVLGHSRLENLRYPTKHRGTLAIYASASRRYLGDPKECPRVVLGAVIGTVTVTDCRPLQYIRDNMRRPEWKWARFHPRVEGPHCLLIANAVLFADPIPWEGRPGFWDFPDDLWPQNPEVKR